MVIEDLLGFDLRIVVVVVEKILVNYIVDIVNKSATNIINTMGMASYSIRSASLEKEEELKGIMTSLVEEFNRKYEGLALAELRFETHLKPFEKADDDRVENVYRKACEKAGVNYEISSFHAGAETHIYCHNKNADGITFMPFLLGLADVFNMHSAGEKVDYKTMLKGYEVLKNTFIEFNLV